MKQHLLLNIPRRACWAALAQLQVSCRKRGLQGHHRSASHGCVLLYSRDDVHGALSLQKLFWEKVRSGWLPLPPVALERPASPSPLPETPGPFLAFRSLPRSLPASATPSWQTRPGFWVWGLEADFWTEKAASGVK